MNTATPGVPADFADWLSPMLVKELRQGLRTRIFIAVFLLIQLVMLLIVTFNLTSLASDPDRFDIDSFNGWFWAMTAVPLLIVMPLRGLTALSSEVRGNTLELVHLTRLTAWRILAGKWFSLMAQSLLLVASVLPYAVLRYFFGDVDLVSDLRNLGVFVALSAAMTAAMTALSTAPLWLRIVALVLSVPFVFIGTLGYLISQMVVRSSPSLPVPLPWFFGAIAVYVPLYVLLLLRIGAARIAPDADNHATWKRCLALVLLVLPFAGILSSDRDVTAWLVLLSLPGVLYVITEALNEPLVLLPPVARSFARFGWPGRQLALALHPGWATAVPLTLGMMAIAAGVVTLAARAADLPRIYALLLTGTGALLLPVLLQRVFFARFRHPFLLYGLIQLAFGAVWSFAQAISAAADSTITPLLMVSPLPLAGTLTLLFHNDAARTGLSDAILTGSGIVTVLVLLALQFKLIPALRSLAAALRAERRP